MPHLATALLGGAVISLLPAVPAAHAAERPAGVLRLSVTDGPESTEDGMISAYRVVLLTCGPTGGGHPMAAAACKQLRKSRGMIEQPAEDVICTKEYAPKTAEARGVWRGLPVRFKHTYGNSCELKAATGVLFDF